MDPKSIKSAGEILKSMLGPEEGEQAKEYHRFFSAWDEIVGENLAGRARAKELKGSTLIVEVDHPGWIQLLEMKSARIVHELNERFPTLEIRKIRYYVAGDPHRPDGAGDSGADTGRDPQEVDNAPADSSPQEPAQAPGSGDSGGSAGSGDSKSPGPDESVPAESARPDESTDTTESTGETDEADSSKYRLDSVLDRLGKHIEGDG